jgi:Tfp pilus assembly protein PilP
MNTGKIFIVIFLCMSLAFLSAQTTTEDKKPQETEKKEPEAVETRVPEEPGPVGTEEELITGDFVYRPKGRRDPFWNLLQGKKQPKREQREGIAGLLIEELELEGIIFKSGTFIALFKGPDGKPYDVKVGNSVYDGEIIKIDHNTVVFKRLLTIALGGTKEKITIVHLIPEEEAAKR